MYFVDTNVLLYAFDIREPARRSRAQIVFMRHRDAGDVWISTQVLQEFYSVASRKLKLDRAYVVEALDLLSALNVAVVGIPEIRRAIDLESVHRIQFWDALILSAAISSGADILYSEDFQHDREYSGVRVLNPFLH